MKTKIRISGSTSAKLMFVKLIKEYGGFGLKEAKDMVDDMMCNTFGRTDYIELEINDYQVNDVIDNFKQIGLSVSSNSREQKLKRVLYQDQTTVLKDMLSDVSIWDKFVTDEDKKNFTYDECRKKAIERIYDNYSEYVKNDNFNILYDEIKEINEMEVKSTEVKILKFNEEFGEFIAEYIKFKGYTYKPYDKAHLVEEMADALQCLLSIYAAIEKETGITLPNVLLEMFEKNKKWMNKISEYKASKK